MRERTVVQELLHGFGPEAAITLAGLPCHSLKCRVCQSYIFDLLPDMGDTPASLRLARGTEFENLVGEAGKVSLWNVGVVQRRPAPNQILGPQLEHLEHLLRTVSILKVHFRRVPGPPSIVA